MLDTHIYISKDRGLTRRSVLWLGLKCDLHCKFCYDAKIDNNKKWISFNKTIDAIKKFKLFYNLSFVDFMGGEPTLFPEILKLIEFSSKIGIRPTCITNAVNLDKKSTLRSYKFAGIHDFLVSIHGIGDTEQIIHQVPFDSFKKQLRSIEIMNEFGIPFRINTTVIQDNLKELSNIARFTVSLGAKVLNFLSFNPYFEWSNINNIRFQVKHSDASPFLKEAIEICKSNNIEVNVRYFPLCTMNGYEQHVFNNFQLPYDCHEWDFNSWFDKGLDFPLSKDWYYEESNSLRLQRGYIHTEKCLRCTAKKICDGIHFQYLKRWGDNELQPFEGETIEDPIFFIKGQSKLEYILDTHRNNITNMEKSKILLSQFDNRKKNRAGLSE